MSVLCIEVHARSARNQVKEGVIRRKLEARLRAACSEGVISRRAFMELMGVEVDLDQPLEDFKMDPSAIEIIVRSSDTNGVRVTQSRRVGGVYLFEGLRASELRMLFFNSVGDGFKSRLPLSKYEFRATFTIDGVNTAGRSSGPRASRLTPGQSMHVG